MGIGDSKGAFHEDAFQHEAAPWFMDPKLDNNVIDPEIDPGSTTPVKGGITPVADVQDDWRDFSEVGNTSLIGDLPTGGEQEQYQQWLSAHGKSDAEKYDYDIQGAYKAGIEPDESGHLPDTYKKPNHITFSDESIFHGGKLNFPDGPETPEGGHWDKDDDGKDTFTPGKSNFDYHTTEEMIDYFKKNEPNARLILPSQ